MSENTKERNPDELGALWVKTSAKDGKKFLSGTIAGTRVVLFKNNFKTADNQPDYRVYKSKELAPAQTTKPAAAKPVTATAAPKKAVVKTKPAPPEPEVDDTPATEEEPDLI